MTIASLLLLALQAPGPVVVLPPQGPEGSRDAAWVGEAVADGLPRALALLDVAALDRLEQLRVQELLDIPAAVPLTRATSIRIAEAVAASRLVMGGYALEGQSVTLSLRVLDLERGALSAPFIASGRLEALGELVHALAWDIALSGPTPPQTGGKRPSRGREDFMAARVDVPFAALKAYAEGLLARDAPTRLVHLRRALKLHPGYDDARLTLGRLQLSSREHAQAAETLGRIPSRSPLARTARFLQGLALLEARRFGEAGAIYAVLVSERPTPGALNNHALALLRSGPPQTGGGPPQTGGGPPQTGGRPARVPASAELRKALELLPGSTLLPYNLGWALLVEGDAEAAAFWLKGVRRDDPRDAHALVAYYWALKTAGKDAEAASAWSDLMALGKSWESYAVPDPARRLERPFPSESGAPVFRRTRSDAERAASHLLHGERLLEAADPDAALKELTQAAYLDPYAPRVHQMLGRAQRARGEAEKALAELRMSLWCRDSVEVRVELAQVLKDLGRLAEARAEAKKALEADPDHEAARRLLN